MWPGGQACLHSAYIYSYIVGNEHKFGGRVLMGEHCPFLKSFGLVELDDFDLGKAGVT